MRTGHKLAVLGIVVSLALFSCKTPEVATPSTPVPTEKPVQTPGGTTPSATIASQQVIDAAKKEGEIVFWTNTIHDKAKIEQQLRSKYPFLKLSVWDARAPEIVTKLAEEAKAGKFTADVIQVTENDSVNLMNLGLIQPYDWPASTQKWTNQPKHNFYRVHEGNLRVMAYNTDLVPPQDVPKTWDDLKNPKWRGRVVLSTSGDENPIGLAYVWGEGGKLNWEKAESYWTEVVQNTRPRVTRGYPIELIASGETALFAMAASINSQLFIDQGAPVNYAPVSPVIMINFALSVTKNPPHPNAARLFVENMTSPEGLLVYTEATRSLVYDPEVAKRSRIHALVDARGIKYIPLPADIYTDANLKRSSEFWLKVLGMR